MNLSLPIRRMCLLAALCSGVASQSLLAAVIHGPIDYNNLAEGSITSQPLINSAQLSGQDVLLISYSVSRDDTSAATRG